MELIETAIHEAGHVVVAYVLGLACNGVALTHEEAEETGSYGHVTRPNPAFGYEISSERDRRAVLRKQCISCCAGLAAVHVFFQVALDLDNENAQGDFQNIIEMEQNGMRIPGKRNGFVGDDATWHYISRRLIDARRLVKRHRGVIERLAKTLVEKKRMNGEEVAKLLAGWMPT